MTKENEEKKTYSPRRQKTTETEDSHSDSSAEAASSLPSDDGTSSYPLATAPTVISMFSPKDSAPLTSYHTTDVGVINHVVRSREARAGGMLSSTTTTRRKLEILPSIDRSQEAFKPQKKRVVSQKRQRGNRRSTDNSRKNRQELSASSHAAGITILNQFVDGDEEEPPMPPSLVGGEAHVVRNHHDSSANSNNRREGRPGAFPSNVSSPPSTHASYDSSFPTTSPSLLGGNRNPEEDDPTVLVPTATLVDDVVAAAEVFVWHDTPTNPEEIASSPPPANKNGESVGKFGRNRAIIIIIGVIALIAVVGGAVIITVVVMREGGNGNDNQEVATPVSSVSAPPTIAPANNLSPTGRPTFFPQPTATPSSGVLTHPPDAVLAWGPVDLPDGHTLGQGNSLALSPDGSALYAITAEGFLYALDPNNDGSVLWRYPQNITTQQYNGCTSGLSLSPKDATAWARRGGHIVYAVVTARYRNAEGTPIRSLVISVNSEGTLDWSHSVAGGVSGTPEFSSNIESFQLGFYVFLTRNVLHQGYFTILAASGIVFDEKNPDVDFKYSPVGIHHNPVEGFYNSSSGPSGLGNSGDIVVWWGGASEIGGRTRAFQFPREGCCDDANALNTVLLKNTSWISDSAPTLGAEGRSLYFAVGGGGNGQMRAWYPFETFKYGPLISDRVFNRDAFQSVELGASSSERQAPASSPVLSNNEFMVFQAGPNNTFHGLYWNLTKVWDNEHSSVIMSKPLVSADDKRVYYVESSGSVHAADTMNGTVYWTYSVQNGVTADCALSARGTMLFCGDNGGLITALTVAT